jgi:hypothetical protein
MIMQHFRGQVNFSKEIGRRLIMNRSDIALIIKAATPMPVSLGPPLPEYFNLRWPGKITTTLLNFEEATATDVKIKNSIIRKIGGKR